MTSYNENLVGRSRSSINDVAMLEAIAKRALENACMPPIIDCTAH